MATTQASIGITSNMNDSAPINIARTMTMHKLETTVGIENTTGFASKKFNSVSAVAVIEEDEVTNSKASKVYMRNTGSSKTDYFYVAINASAAAAATTETIGRLYGGDWMMIPYEGAVNLTVAPSTTNTMTLEYAIFYE